MLENPENKKSSLTLEREANFEGNDTLLLLERLNNPAIKQKLVDLFFKYQEPAEPQFTYDVDENDEWVKIPTPNWKPIYETKEEIKTKIEQRIKEVFSVTNINLSEDFLNYSEGSGDGGMVSFNSINPENGEKFTTKQISIIEAHEKGHGVRAIFKPFSEFPEITNCLDLSKIEITDKLKELFINKDNPSTSPEERILEYFGSPNEIIERMSQLKNYFGMSGDEKFTKEHLDYAKKHYLSDTGMGIQMKPFLDAITDKTEKAFLNLVNTLGI